MLRLHVPDLAQLHYRAKLLADPSTMSYNKGYSLGFAEYDNATGCIAFPPDQRAGWFARWIGREPERFYAYLADEAGQFAGEVSFHGCGEDGVRCIGIVVEASQRGKGYAAQGLSLLIAKARALGIDKLRNDFETSRTAALRAHLHAGFTVVSQKDGVCVLELAPNP